MSTIANLVVKLKLDKAGFGRGIKAAVKAAEDADKKIGKSVNNIAKNSKNSVAQAADSFYSLGKGIKTVDMNPILNGYTAVKAGAANLRKSLGGITGPFAKLKQVGSTALRSLSTSFKSSMLGEAAIGIGRDIGGALKTLGPMAKTAGMGMAQGLLIGGAALAGLAVAAAGAGAAVVGALAAITKKAFSLAESAAPVQGIKASFDAMASSFQGGSSAMLSALQDASAGMISNTELMQKYNLASQLVSNDFANTLPDAIEMIGKVAMSTGQDFDFLLNSYTTAAGRLSPMIADNLAITVDAQAAYQAYAQEIGSTVEALSKQEKQTAFANEMLRQLEKNTANLPPVFGSAAQVFQAFRTDLKNIKDDVGMDLLPTFTELFSFFRKGVPLLRAFGQGFAGTFSGMAQLGKSVIQGFARGMGIDLEALANNSESWGANIVTQLARGMAKAIGAVISVLNQLGQIIAGWLAPGSPPKLLPDLPEWGENAANWFLKGFPNANVGILRDLGSMVENYMRSTMAGDDSTDIASAIMNTRKAMQTAATSGGDVMSVLPSDVRGYASALIEAERAATAVAAAQKALNEVTKVYDDRLKPVTDELAAIAAKRQGIINDMRAEELQAIVDDASADPLAKELALMELREIELQNQQAAIEAEKATAVDAAQAKLDAAQAEHEMAQERLDLQEMLLQQQIEMNNLMASTLDTLSGIGAGAAGAAGGIAGLTEGLTGLGAAGAGVSTTLSQSMSELATSIMEEFTSLGGEAQELGGTWATVVENAKTRWGTMTKWFRDNFGEGGKIPTIIDGAKSFIADHWGEGGTWEGIMNNLKRTGGLLVDEWNNQWGEGGTWDGIVKTATRLIREQWGEGGTWSGIIDNAKRTITLLKDKVEEQMDKIRTAIDKATGRVGELWEKILGFWNWIKDRTFNFNFNTNIPESHDAHSPLPLHTAWQNFDRYLSNRTFGFDFQTALDSPVLSGAAMNGLGNSPIDYNQLAAMMSSNRPFANEVNVNNGMDEAELRAKVLRWVRQDAGR